MSQILEEAIEKLRQMPEDHQDRIARLMLHEIEEDQRWMHSSESNTPKLRGLVDEILEADDRGECKPLDPDRL